MTNRSRRAIALISVLFFTVLVLMFVGAAIALAPSSISRASADSSLAAADRAAKSGLDWVRARISEDPTWTAAPTKTFNNGGFYVTEGNGQVEGWVADNGGWSRFRIRFNYQDGPASSAANSDSMNDPPVLLTDFPYVTCNNLLGGGSKQIPVASGSLGAYTSSGPWTNTQLTVPANTLLLSVEGAFGPGVTMSSAGHPTGYASGFHKKNVQCMLKMGNNQPITAAAIMAAGDLAISAMAPGTQVQLGALSGQTGRLRTKSNLNINVGVQSADGDLRYGPSTVPTLGPLSSGVTKGPEGSDGFFKIPASKVRTPQSPLTLNAGTYVVTFGGSVMYYNMSYPDFVAASPPPAGTPFLLPAGMALTGPNATGPKFTLSVTKDVTISPSGTIKDFALIPDGGAPQSANYGGVALSTPSASPTVAPATYVTYMLTTGNADGQMNSAGLAAWNNFATNKLTLIASGISANFSFDSGVYNEYQVPGTTTTLWLATNANGPHWANYSNLSGGAGNPGDIAAAMIAAGGSYVSDLQTAMPSSAGATGSTSPSSSPSASATPTLSPKDLELQLNGGSAGLTFANEGNITIGAQVKGNSSSLVSQGDIALIGTSTNLSSSPGASLGLNLYAQGNVTIDTYKLDSAAATSSFEGVNLKGVIYAWQNVNILSGRSATDSAPFSLTGTLVAYGGDPAAGGPNPGSAATVINASTVSITYDPSFVASLLQSGPFTLDVLSWHEF